MLAQRPILLLLLAAACGREPDTTPPGPVPPMSNIEHLVVIIQENISFDAYYGTWCEAPPGSNPECTEGPACCEAAPATDPGTGAAPFLLNDSQHGAFDPTHRAECHISEINGGLMDQFVEGAVCGSDPENFAYADEASVGTYRAFASTAALADRWFQPVVGGSSANDMYYARAAYVFTDNTYVPDGAYGTTCTFNQQKASYTDPTIGDLLADAGVPWSFYMEGYQETIDAVDQGDCPAAMDSCPIGIPYYPCTYDPSDIPFQYYPRFQDDPAYMKDYEQLAGDIAAGQLPAVTYVKAIGFRTEHPGYGHRISDGVAFTTALIDSLLASEYADDTLILLTYDESGGYFDHVPPPPTSAIDGQPYGPRLPTWAIGRFARAGHISHVTLEHSSIVKFIEWNWLGGETGQLGTRDTEVNNLGSLIDADEAGIAVPED
jgi:phospholipase C